MANYANGDTGSDRAYEYEEAQAEMWEADRIAREEYASERFSVDGCTEQTCPHHGEELRRRAQDEVDREIMRDQELLEEWGYL